MNDEFNDPESNLERIDALEQKIYDILVKHLDGSLSVDQMKEVIKSGTLSMLKRLLNEAIIVENYELCQAVKGLITKKKLKTICKIMSDEKRLSVQEMRDWLKQNLPKPIRPMMISSHGITL